MGHEYLPGFIYNIDISGRTSNTRDCHLYIAKFCRTVILNVNICHKITLIKWNTVSKTNNWGEKCLKKFTEVGYKIRLSTELFLRDDAYFLSTWERNIFSALFKSEIKSPIKRQYVFLFLIFAFFFFIYFAFFFFIYFCVELKKEDCVAAAFQILVFYLGSWLLAASNKYRTLIKHNRKIFLALIFMWQKKVGGTINCPIL